MVNLCVLAPLFLNRLAFFAHKAAKPLCINHANKFCVLFKPLCPTWTLLKGHDNKTESSRIHLASLQEHLGVPRALGILSLRAGPSHPVREQKQPMCQLAVTKEWRVDWQLKESWRMLLTGSPGIPSSPRVPGFPCQSQGERKTTGPVWQVLNGIIISSLLQPPMYNIATDDLYSSCTSNPLQHSRSTSKA